MRRLALLWLLVLGFAVSLPAAETGSKSAESDASSNGLNLSYSPNWPDPPNTTGMLLRLGFGTVVTLGLCVATILGGRRWLQRAPVNAATRQLHVEETVSLGHRAALYLVRFGDTRLIAGTDTSGLKSLVVVPALFPEMLDQRLEEPASVSPDRATASSPADLASIQLPRAA